MSIYIVLDILLVLLILLLTPIGFWRGPVKELFVTLGILFGVLISDYWARPWGNDLADMTSLTSGAGAFLVAMIFLITSTFILGYGLGATLAPARHNTTTRILGAGVAALNGALILSFALQYIRLFLLSDINEESLNKSVVTRFLLNDIGWILLIAAIVAIPLLIYVLATGYRVYALSSDDPRIYTTAATPIAGRGRANARDAANPPRVPVSARGEHPAYKAEPPAHEQSVTNETRPVIVTESSHTTDPDPAEDLADEMSDTDPHIVLPRQTAAEPKPKPAPAPASAQPEPAPQVEDPTGQADASESTLPTGYVHCRTCRAVLGPEMKVCPNCGTEREG